MTGLARTSSIERGYPHMIDLVKKPNASAFPIRYSVRYETYAVGDRFGLLTCLIRDDKEGHFVGASTVKFEQSAQYGHASRESMSYSVVDAIGSLRSGGWLYKTWDELRELTHSLAVDDAMRNGHHMVLVQGGDRRESV